MRKIREVLRLRWERGLSQREIAISCKLARSTVGEYLARAQSAGLAWPLPKDLDDAALEARLFRLPEQQRGDERRPEPDWERVHRELKRKGVTLTLLWQEYREVHPDGYQYSRFCDLYRDWRGLKQLVMRQNHKAGEKLFVDYAGQTVDIVDPTTGEITSAQIFVAVLGASNYAYCEATKSQSSADFIGAQVRALEYFGGCPAIVVPDNTKTGVKHPHLYEPDLNRSYLDFADHYGLAVIPARVSRPKDKAKVEHGVLTAERWILARLRHRTFFSLRELNEAIFELLERYNDTPFQKLSGSRRSLFLELEQPALRPLPKERYVFASWKKVRVHVDYHVEVDRHYYSVPYQLVGKQLDARATNATVELFHQGRRIASHVRSHRSGHHTTVNDHMPKSHRHYANWTPERLIKWASQAGGATAKAVEVVMASRPHPQQGFRSCLGVMRLGKSYGENRLEAACQRALALGSVSYKSIESILKNGLDQEPLPKDDVGEAADELAIAHGNIRGADYYASSASVPATDDREAR